MLLENPPGSQQQNINEDENPSNNSDSSGFTELEQILKQKTFTRQVFGYLHSFIGPTSSKVSVCYLPSLWGAVMFLYAYVVLDKYRECSNFI